MRFVHGTTTAHLSSIESVGLAPPEVTKLATEKRHGRLNVVHILAEEHSRLAGGYALRPTLHFGGEPILVFGKIADEYVELSIPGHNMFPDIHSTPAIAPENITDIVPFTAQLDDMSELFKAHKSQVH